MAEQSTNMVRILDFFKTNQSGKSQNKSAETKKSTVSQPAKQEVLASHQGPQSTAVQNTFVATDSDEWEEF
jgi:hypothetical protein